MEEWSGGGYYDEEKNKPNLYQRVSTHKQKELSHSMDFANVDMMWAIKNAQSCLKKINTIEARSKIEMKKYGSTSVICSP